MYNRLFKLPNSLSFFLLGARATGKSTLLKQSLKGENVLWVDLLDVNMLARFSTNPMELEKLIVAAKQPLDWVVIDEIQRVPNLLDVVHRQIENSNCRFALTGSSARKLKRGAANLLAGRALENYLFPLTHVELAEDFDLNFCLRWGSLPQVFSLSLEERQHYLKTYANVYLREEIQAEQILRKLPPFRAFLEVVAQTAGQIVNYTKIARDIGSNASTVISYFEILEDTLLGLRLNPYATSIRKRQRKNPKFFFFDLGVQRALTKVINLDIQQGTYDYGRLFEQWVFLEMHRLSVYHHNDWQFSYFESGDGVEIDLVIERPGKPLALIEIKSSFSLKQEQTKTLNRISQEIEGSVAYCLSNDRDRKKYDNVLCLHWKEGMKELGLQVDGIS